MLVGIAAMFDNERVELRKVTFSFDELSPFSMQTPFRKSFSDPIRLDHYSILRKREKIITSKLGASRWLDQLLLFSDKRQIAVDFSGISSGSRPHCPKLGQKRPPPSWHNERIPNWNECSFSVTILCTRQWSFLHDLWEAKSCSKDGLRLRGTLGAAMRAAKKTLEHSCHSKT
jgi:hypothetical protein